MCYPLLYQVHREIGRLGRAGVFFSRACGQVTREEYLIFAASWIPFLSILLRAQETFLLRNLIESWTCARRSRSTFARFIGKSKIELTRPRTEETAGGLRKNANWIPGEFPGLLSLLGCGNFLKCDDCSCITASKVFLAQENGPCGLSSIPSRCASPFVSSHVRREVFPPYS